MNAKGFCLGRQKPRWTTQCVTTILAKIVLNISFNVCWRTKRRTSSFWPSHKPHVMGFVISEKKELRFTDSAHLCMVSRIPAYTAMLSVQTTCSLFLMAVFTTQYVPCWPRNDRCKWSGRRFMIYPILWYDWSEELVETIPTRDCRALTMTDQALTGRCAVCFRQWLFLIKYGLSGTKTMRESACGFSSDEINAVPEQLCGRSWQWQK